MKMWAKMKRMFKKFFNVFKVNRNDKDRYDGTEEERFERLEHLLSQRLIRDMELQSDGKWLSRSLIDAICAETCEQKLLNLCDQKKIHRLESLFTRE